jgi:heat shock protein HslJ
VRPIATAALAAMLCASVAAALHASPSAARAPSATAPAPSLDQLRNLKYSGFADGRAAVTLVRGRYESAPGFPRRAVTLVDDFRLTGDVYGDGRDVAVVLLAESTGGSGTFDYVAVAGVRGGSPQNLATAPLGDRVQVRNGRITNRRLVVDVLRAGPNDAMCCPGELATLAFEMRGTRLERVPSGVAPGRLSLAVLADGVWVLRAWAWDEPVEPGIEVTLNVKGEHLAGRAACNAYFALATPAAAPGDLTIGTAGTTKMACPEPQMKAEQRFLGQLAKVQKYSFVAGQLALSWNQDGKLGTMLFARLPPKP